MTSYQHRLYSNLNSNFFHSNVPNNPSFPKFINSRHCLIVLNIGGTLLLGYKGKFLHLSTNQYSWHLKMCRHKIHISGFVHAHDKPSLSMKQIMEQETYWECVNMQYLLYLWCHLKPLWINVINILLSSTNGHKKVSLSSNTNCY